MGFKTPLLPAALTVAAALLSVAVSAQAAPAADKGGTNLNRIVLRAAQVGPGYRLQQRPDGHGVHGFVTLDLCGFSFPSERLRTARLQVNYLHRGSAVGLSNEVVSYRPGGAQQALRELAHAADNCPSGPVGSNVQGVPPLTYRIHRINDPRLIPGYVALRIHMSATINGKQRQATQIAIYQARANVLSGVYTFAHTVTAQLRVGLHAAEQSAKNLKRWAYIRATRSV